MTEFWRGKKVLITGDTGFKGSWLKLWLHDLGARCFGCALEPDTTPSLFCQLDLGNLTDKHICDIRDAALLAARVLDVEPDVIFHLAAQPLVGQSYVDPLETWSSNVMGTANLLSAAQNLAHNCAIVVVTTDKVYQNFESGQAYREADRLGGHDPYSASKAATELVVSSWRKSFFHGNSPVRIASARAGNVIGGGDWAENRLVPDIARALVNNEPVKMRNAGSIRPWQHVLDPLAGYMTLARHLFTSEDTAFQSAFNFGPDNGETRTVQALVDACLSHWPGAWANSVDKSAPHEAGLLSLDITKAQQVLGWSPKWKFAQAVEKTITWYRRETQGQAPLDMVRQQISEFEAS